MKCIMLLNIQLSKLGASHPIHLLGIGDPIDIWNLVKYGIDTFDCVSPTRLSSSWGCFN